MECRSVRPKSCGTYRSLLDNIDVIGIESLFSLDALRQNREPRCANSLFEKLNEMTTTCPLLLLSVLPQIFNSFVQCMKHHRSALYTQRSTRGPGSTELLLTDGMSFFASCHSLLEKTISTEETWTARSALLSVVEKENLFSPSQRDAEPSLKQAGELAITLLDNAWNGKPSQSACFLLLI